MSNVIHLTDNYSIGTPIPQESIPDILQIANIGRLQNVPDLLVFPHSFLELKDGIGELSIVTLRDVQYEKEKCVSVKACTGNLMGFVGVNDTSISIHSRFTHKKEDGIVDGSSPDYFLYYMLQKVLSINVFNLEHTSSREDKVLDFLLFLFPLMLKKAMSQGLYKEYRRYQHDDAKVKGTIDVNRFIRTDIPFRGTISYTTREHSYDNTITQLIRHTIEYIQHHPFGHTILNNDAETVEIVRQIVMSTPTYSQRERQRILNANRRPKVHPYFTKYRELQQLCVHILRHESLKYGKEKDRIHGVLFDGAWLWEEYLNTILKKTGFIHPENKLKLNGFQMFEKANEDEFISRNSRKLYPDFYKDNFILDAKYKHLNSGIGREDLFQVVSYMYCKRALQGGYVFPDEGTANYCKFQLTGYHGYINLIPVKIPQNAQNYQLFIDKANHSEQALISIIKSIEQFPKMKEMDDIHPLTIISDRYSGCYSSGKYLAFNLEPWDVPREVDGSDRVCARFWWSDDCKKFVIGKGDTPEEAYCDLVGKMQQP